jgi:hypothetical protein
MADLNAEKLLHEQINSMLEHRVGLIDKNKAATVELNSALADSINKLNETHAAALSVAESMERAAQAAALLAGTELPEFNKFAKGIKAAQTGMSGMLNHFDKYVQVTKNAKGELGDLGDVIESISGIKWTQAERWLDKIPFIGSGLKETFNSVFDAAGVSGDEFIKNLTSKFPGASKTLGTISTKMGAFTKFAGTASVLLLPIGVAFKGIMDASNKALNAGKAYFAFIGKAASMAASTLWALWGVWSGLIQKIGEAAKKVEEWARQVFVATEGVRDKLGDLAQGIGEATMDIVSSFDGLGNLSAGAIFGPFEEGAVAMREFFGEAVADLGNQAEALRGQLVAAGEYFVALKKGVGLSGEAMSGLAATTFATGKTLKQTFAEVNTMVATLAKKFGVSTKTIGKNLSQIAGNLADFGHMSTQEMVQLAATISKVGIEMKTVLGIAKQFDMFEGAAQSVAKLNQAFGMQLDAMEMMNASDEERMAMLQASFAATGRNIQDLSRQERQYLAQQAGVDAGELDKFFGNYAESIGAAGDAAADAADQQMSEKEALNDIAKSIKQALPYLVQATTALGAFFEGFEQGFLRSEEGQKFMLQLRDILNQIFDAGIKAGDAFAQIMEQAGGFKIVEGWFRASLDALTMFSNLLVDLAGDLNTASTPEEKSQAWLDFTNGIIKILEDQYENFSKAFAGMLDFMSNNESSVLGPAITRFTTWLRDKIVEGLLAGWPVIAAVLAGGFITALLAAVPTLLTTVATIMAVLGAAVAVGTIGWPAAILAAFVLALPLVLVALAAIATSIFAFFEYVAPLFAEKIANMMGVGTDKIIGLFNILATTFKMISAMIIGALIGVVSAIVVSIAAAMAPIWAIPVSILAILTFVSAKVATFVGTITNMAKGLKSALSLIPGFGGNDAAMGVEKIPSPIAKIEPPPSDPSSSPTGGWFSGLTDILSSSGDQAVQVASDIDGIGESVNALPKELDLLTQVKDFKKGGTQIEEQLKVQMEKAEFTFNLTVELDAEKLAGALATKTIAGSNALQKA